MDRQPVVSCHRVSRLTVAYVKEFWGKIGKEVSKSWEERGDQGEGGDCEESEEWEAEGGGMTGLKEFGGGMGGGARGGKKRKIKEEKRSMKKLKKRLGSRKGKWEEGIGEEEEADDEKGTVGSKWGEGSRRGIRRERKSAGKAIAQALDRIGTTT